MSRHGLKCAALDHTGPQLPALPYLYRSNVPVLGDVHFNTFISVRDTGKTFRKDWMHVISFIRPATQRVLLS